MSKFMDAYHNQDADTKAALHDLETERLAKQHAPNCAFHLDQYPWECTCRALLKARGE